MNVIEALFVTLGLDTSDYDKKQKGVITSLTKMGETSDKQTKIIAESGKKAAQSFSMLKIEVLGALAAFGLSTGFKSFIESSMSGQAALGRLSANLGMSTQKLQAWRLAAKEMGQSGEDATNALQSVAKGVAEAKINGTSSLIQASRRFGFGVDTKNPEQTLINISRRMAMMHDRQQAMQIAEAAGVGNIANLLLQGPDALQAQLAHAMSLTGAATKASTEQAAKLQAQWADLQERFQQVGDRVFNKLEPILAKLGERLAKWIDSINWQKVIDQIGRFIDKVQQINWQKVIDQIGRFIDKVQQIVKEMGGWKTIAEVLGGVLALKILSPILTLITLFSRLLLMFVGATTGVTGLAAAFGTLGVAIAVAGGAWIGSHIYHDLMENNASGRAAGDLVAKSLAALGIKSAQEAVLQTEGKGPANHSGDFHPERTDAYKVKEKQAIQYFQSQGFSRNAAIGMTANIARESHFNQRIVGDNGKAYGIGQWHPDRQANFAKVMGLPIQGSSYQQQLDFYAYEVKHNKRLMGMLSPADTTAPAAAMAVSMLHERPADKVGEMERRARIAQSMSNAYIGAKPSSLAGEKSSTNTNTVSINTLNVNAPKATDANGIAKGMKTAMQSNPLIAGYVTSLA